MTQMTVPQEFPPGRTLGSVPTVFTVRATGAHALARLGEQITADPLTNPDWYCRQADRAARSLPTTISDELADFAEVGTACGALVMRGLNVAEIPATPLNNTQGLAGSTSLARQMAVLAQVLGSMVCYEAEGHGHLIQDMVPNPDLADTQQSQASAVELEAHTEQGFSPLRPDYVLLGCLRGDPKAFTYAFSARQLLQHLTADETAMLRKPLWTTAIDSSFQPFVPNPDEVRGPWPILAGPVDDPTMVVDQDLMFGITAAAQKLLMKVIEIYLEHRTAHVLAAGEVLILDNARAMHGRSTFSPRFDGADRFIARGFCVRDRRARLGAMASDRRTIRADQS